MGALCGCFPKIRDDDDVAVERYMEKKRSDLLKRLQHRVRSKKFTIFSFKDHSFISRGGYGIVLQAWKGNKPYAIKRVVMTESRLETTINEKNILFAIDFPFIVKLYYTFKNHTFVYFVLELVDCGPMVSYIEYESMGELTTIFWLAQLVLAVEYLHSGYIIHRDIKPENILVDRQGYIRLTDFDTAKVLSKGGLTSTMCGTTLYNAPEMMAREPYGFGVDWWSVGTVGYCCLFSEPPMAMEVEGSDMRVRREVPSDWEGVEMTRFENLSEPLGQLLYDLLRADPTVRLGVVPGSSDVKRERCFDQIEWSKLYNKKFPSPIIPYPIKLIPYREVSEEELVREGVDLDEVYKDF